MRLAPLFAFGLSFASLFLACGGDDAASPKSPLLKKSAGGDAGAAGEDGEGGSGGNGFPGGGQGNGSGGSGQAGSSAGTDSGPTCVTSPPELPACTDATDCQACLCDKCADAWADCMADDECKKAVSCVAAGCSLSQCGSLTSGEASLAKAEAIEDCRASKQKCRTACTGGGTVGAGGSGQAGAGGSGEGGSETAGSGQGGGGPVEAPQCCELSDKPGCSGLPFALLTPDEQAVETCVCANDSFCCQNQWDDVCVKEITEFGCAPACPAGSGGSGGAGGSDVSGGSGGSDVSGGSGGSDVSGGSGGSDVSGGAGGGSTGECQPLVFPSGIALQTKKDSSLTAQYDQLGSASCSAPVCFLDASDLRSADGTPQTVKVKISANFTLYELIRTDIDPNNTGAYDPSAAYSARVLVAPALVEKLQKLREIYGSAVVITSGFRSPAHQKELCNSICGKDQCTDGSGTVTCAKNSRHMWGAAADMDLKYESAANAAGFPFVFHENGGTAPHLHVDMLSCL